MSKIYNSPDCGTNRQYVFRPIEQNTFVFQVKAKHDVNICLSPTSSEIPCQQYEIFIGAWEGGGESGIRRNKKDDVLRVKTPNILDAGQFRGFWIAINPHEIKVGKQGQSTPFLLHRDTTLRMNFSYYGYCTAYGSTGQWIFEDEDFNQGIDMDSFVDVLEEIVYPEGAGYQPEIYPAAPTSKAYPPVPAPPPPYYPPTPPGKIYNSPDCSTNRQYVFRPMEQNTFAFQVKAKHDVNICLSPTSSEIPYQQYEIFIGGWEGRESAIRRNKKDDVHKVKTPNILDAGQFRGFWITINPHEIKVGKQGQSTPFLLHRDTAVRMNVSYYGYCTAYGSTGQWIFEDDDYGQGIAMGSFAVVPDEFVYPQGAGAGYQRGIYPAASTSMTFPPVPTPIPTPRLPYYPPTYSGKIHNTPDCGTNRQYVFRPIEQNTFVFQVKAKSNVNICLSPTSSETPYQQYEIFIGGWEGKESAIRRNKKDDVHKVKTPNIVHAGQFRGFWITINPHEIKVGKQGQNTPFLLHRDTAVRMDFSYYGYCTAYGSTGQWIFEDDDRGQEIDMGSFVHVLDDIMYPAGAGYQPGIYPAALTSLAYPPVPASIPAPPPPYYPPTTSGSIKWIRCTSLSMCPSPVEVSPGPNNSYVAIAHHKSALTPGCLTPPQFSVCHISWGCQAHHKMDFYLLSNPRNVELLWQSASGGSVPAGAIQGGYSENGEPLYIGRFRHAGNHPGFRQLGATYLGGKVHPSHKVCYAPFQGMEVSNRNYEVLCLKTVPLTLLGI